MKKRILVVGGGGLIGKPLSNHLSKKGYEIYVIDNFCNSDNEGFLEEIVIKKFDICNKEIVKIIEEIKPEIVFHLACNYFF
jgi:nucleoside-diphosphate-sugar epimerase